jgi:hypothetical protein
MVAPGTYTARLSVGTFSQTAHFEVRMDPRVEKEGITTAGVAAQTELALKARDALGQARKLAADVAEALKTEVDPDRRDRLTAARDVLTTTPVRYSRPMLVDQLEYLYSNLIRADQRPGQDAYERFAELSALLAEQQKALDEPAKPARKR